MSWEQAPPSRRVRQLLWPGVAVATLIAVVTLVLLSRSDGPTGTLNIGPTAEPAGGPSAAPSVNPSDFAPTPLDPLDGSTEDAGDGPLLPATASHFRRSHNRRPALATACLCGRPVGSTL